MTKQIKWNVERRKVSDLLLWSKNPRSITEEALEKLKERIVKRGFHDVIKIDVDGTILSGNQRRAALIDLGIEEVTVLLPDRKLTKEEKEKVALESNINDGEWSFEELKNFNLDMLLDIGFDKDELSDIWDDKIGITEDDFDEEEEVKKIKIPKTKLGDLIILGSNKLICGDSNDPEIVKRLFGEDRASMVMSDPVYNINLPYRTGLGGTKDYGADVEDNRTEEEYIEFLRQNISVALQVVKPDCHIFYWNTEQQIWILQTLYRELGISNKRVCLWVKNGQNMTPQIAFDKCYEPCIYGTIGSPYLSKKEHGLNEVMNKGVGTGNNLIDDVNIWTAKRISTSKYSHATSKPVGLYEKSIKRCTKPGDIILDTFGGSGSTLIAGEQLQRKVYMVELEPVFCDVIINRYEKVSGKKAEVVSSHEER